MSSKGTKKSLLASGISLLASCALLAGTTFAWFTDSVTNAGNKIQAGKLEVALSELQADGTYQEVGDTSIFSYDKWEPGYSDVAVLKVENKGTLALKYQVDIVANGENSAELTKLAEAIDVYALLNQNTAITEIPTGTDGMTNLGSLKDVLADGQNVVRGNLKEKEADYAAIVLKMRETAGNEYQGLAADVTFDIVLKATQDTVETDGFDSSDYDAGAHLDFALVRTAEQLKAVADQGGVIEMMGSVELDEDLVFSRDTVIRLNGQTITVNGSLKAPVNTTLTIEGNGTIHGVLYAEKTMMKSGTIVVNAGENFEVVAPAGVGYAVYGGMGSTIRLNGGTYRASAETGAGVIEVMGSSTLEVRDATVEVGADSVIDAMGIHSSASTNLLENVTVHANYSRALYFNNEYGSSMVRGGTFVTDRRADAEFYNPTISYMGTLDISDATIERVGVGILYAKKYPQPTEVEGLTCERCTFIPTDEEARQYLDVDYHA